MALLSHTHYTLLMIQRKDVLQKYFHPKYLYQKLNQLQALNRYLRLLVNIAVRDILKKHILFYLTDFQQYAKVFTNLFGYFPKKWPRICLGLVELVRGKTQDSASFHGRWCLSYCTQFQEILAEVLCVCTLPVTSICTWKQKSSKVGKYKSQSLIVGRRRNVCCWFTSASLLLVGA